jgi:hypothetical protein
MEGLVVYVQGLDIEILAVRAILAEPKPGEGIEHRRLADRVIPGDIGDPAELQVQAPDALEILEAQAP